MVNSIDGHFRFLESALKARSYRQEVLGANIANADTPNYKAKDFDFKSALTNALGNSSNGQQLQLQTTNGAHFAGASETGFSGAELQYRVPKQPSIDGNTVEAEDEMARFTDNALQYQALLNFTTGKIKTLQQAMASQ
ncbi:flagellar basal body rod protein FlgB [Leeia sp. TBRC 13508]|uniref:Flagellar basal body rod protein FlgB n=1 Tax=Leeia speluncae TaxID=2884804 RepID=A0ABS8D9H9_9NEIS|nr:flagellar basal body rod protein FlgB [Leeia speluncae]MCB6184782.1 flagellar basal body rod protein FlgB [Leeia speluncae]